MLALIRAVSQSDRGLAALNLVQHNYCVIMLLPPPSVAAPKLARAFFGAEVTAQLGESDLSHAG
jgi:hypothetical protein